MNAPVDGKYYEVAARYVDPKMQMGMATSGYQHMKANPPAAKGVDFDSLTESFFANRVGRVIALMVLVNRRPEAEKLAQEALATSDSAQVKETVDAALAGQVPPSG